MTVINTTMTKEKEIEELAGDLCYLDNNPFDYDTYDLQAWYLIGEGWYKQREGEIIETTKDGRINRRFSCCGTDCTEMTKWLVPNFCPYCGAQVTREELTGDA